MKVSLILFLVLLSLKSFAADSDLVNDSDLIGDVIDLKTNQKIYTEFHSFEIKQGKQTLTSTYLTPEQQSLGQREVVFEQDRVQLYQLDQTNIGYSESVVRNSEFEITISGGMKNAQTEKQLPITRNRPVIIDAGFSNFIIRNWDTLVSGKTLKLDFASPAQMSIVRLQVKHVDNSVSPSQSDVAMFEMNIANPILRFLLSPIEVGYYADSKQLAYYKGSSNLKNTKGKYFDVEIKFAKNPNYADRYSKPSLASQ